MKKTAEEIKNKIANDNNFDSFDIALRYTVGRELLPSEKEFLNKIINESMEEFSNQDKWVSVETPPKKLDEFELQREATKRSDYLQKKSGWRGFIEGASWMQDLLFPSPPKTK